MLRKFINEISRYKISVIIFILALLITFTTSGIAAYKIVKISPGSFPASNIEEPRELVLSPITSVPTVLVTPTVVKLISTKANTIQPTVRFISKPSSIVAPTQIISPPNVQVVSKGGCIITLFGQQYDTTNLRKTHSGGDVFKCGTDMTSVYQNKHGSNVSMMQPYLITGGGSSNAQITQPPQQQNPGSQPSGKPQKEEEDDD